MKKTFRIKLMIKDCDIKFTEELGPGVLGIHEVTYDLSEKDYESPLFTKELLEQQDALVNDIVYTVVLLDEKE